MPYAAERRLPLSQLTADLHTEKLLPRGLWLKSCPQQDVSWRNTSVRVKAPQITSSRIRPNVTLWRVTRTNRSVSRSHSTQMFSKTDKLVLKTEGREQKKRRKQRTAELLLLVCASISASGSSNPVLGALQGPLLFAPLHSASVEAGPPSAAFRVLLGAIKTATSL